VSAGADANGVAGSKNHPARRFRFCREELMSWCETHAVDYVFGLARNERLRVQIESEMQAAAGLYAATGKPARVFTVKRENFRWADLVQET